MFKDIFKFELRYWLKQPMLYIFFLINAFLIFGASSNDNITVGGSIGNTHKNAPYVVENFYVIMSILSLLMITAFLNSAAARDYSEKTNQILFTTPLKKSSFIFGRFFGAFIISIIPFLGISLGNLIGASSLFWDPERIGPTIWSGHIMGLLVFIIPNLFFAGSIIFSIAALTRNTVLSFVGTIGLLVGYLISLNMVSDLSSEFLGAMLDPFAIRTFNVVTKYWTVDDKNTLAIGFEGYLLLNRLLWTLVGAGVLAFTYFRFSFEEKSTKVKKSKLNIENNIQDNLKVAGPIIKVLPTYNNRISLKQFFSQVRIETISILKNTAFIVIMIFGILNLVSSMSFATSQGYGNTAFPVTYNVISIIQGSFFLFVIAVITFYTGSIVWKERDYFVNDIYDSLPYSNWIPLISKSIALWLVIEVLLIMSCFIGILTQLYHGFSDIRLEQYFIDMVLINGMSFFSLICLSLFIHILVNNKYLGYFVFIAFLAANSFGWPALGIESNLIQFGASPELTYSDMNGYGPFLKGKLFFETYWILFSLILLIVGLLFWIRGRDTGAKIRISIASQRIGSIKPVLIVLIICWIIVGGFLYYNTKIINTYVTSNDYEKRQVQFESLYKKYEHKIQPRVTDIEYSIDLFAAQRNLQISSLQWVKNKNNAPIDTIYFTMPVGYKATIAIAGAKQILNDTLHKFCMYRLGKSLLPNDSIQINYTSSYTAVGIENEVSNTSIVDNGSFFNNIEILPQVGYQADYEIQDKNKRKKYNLLVRERVQKLSNDSSKRMNTYLSNNSDWVNVKTIFSTDIDQIAIAPGSLKKEWKKNNRAYYQYELDHYSFNFYSFMSGKYEVKRAVYNGINLEVYYDKKHFYNVDKMLMSMRKSIEYYSENFGPYYHKQTRIIEFPRYASFAQAFPGTMPYSEAIGFIANLEDSDDIDMVTYVVAHEMGHQWWAHQICGPDMQGTTLLSESMAQYSALSVMEKMYGKEQMHKFLKYEMDKYLRARGTESEKELPLMLVENQGYIHYNKASVIMFYLKEMIGAEKVNYALKDMINNFAYKDRPYPNSNELVNRFEQQTPDSLKYLIKDLFKNITIFDNRISNVKMTKVSKGYEVKFTATANKFYADSLGHEKQVAINDWIQVGIFDKPKDGKKYGKLLKVESVLFNKKEQSFTMITKDIPYQVGIDPYYYLVDKVPDDNLKKIDQL